MRAAFSKAELESEISGRFGQIFKVPDRRFSEVISTGIREIDGLTEGGFPRGALTEIYGPPSSGRTSVMLAMLAHGTTHDEVCAVVDTNDAFDPSSAANAGINLDQLLWIRCAGNLEHAFKATDLLLQGGGFGIVMLDLGDVAGKDARRIISSWWYRFRRVVENSPAVLLVISRESCVRSCASLALELKADSVWSIAGTPPEGQSNTSHKGVAPSVYSLQNHPWTLPAVSHSSLLQGNLIKTQRRRPLVPSQKECSFPCQAYQP